MNLFFQPVVAYKNSMSPTVFYRTLTLLIAFVWIANGLFSKVLNLVPRHQEIVASILGDDYARPLTIMIGVGEIILGILILNRFKPKILAILQILLVATMNIMEYLLVPDLLLWGKFNSLFALGFIILVYYHEFILSKNLEQSS